jgi:hypothetical protein
LFVIQQAACVKGLSECSKSSKIVIKLAVKPWRSGLYGLGDIGLGLRVRDSHYRSHGSDIGNRRRSCVNSPLHIVVIVWSPIGALKMLIVAVKVMRPGAIPAIGMPTGVVIRPIWICLGAQGA